MPSFVVNVGNFSNGLFDKIVRSERCESYIVAESVSMANVREFRGLTHNEISVSLQVESGCCWGRYVPIGKDVVNRNSFWMYNLASSIDNVLRENESAICRMFNERNLFDSPRTNLRSCDFQDLRRNPQPIVKFDKRYHVVIFPARDYENMKVGEKTSIRLECYTIFPIYYKNRMILATHSDRLVDYVFRYYICQISQDVKVELEIV